jgi:hypothetical protein
MSCRRLRRARRCRCPPRRRCPRSRRRCPPNRRRWASWIHTTRQAPPRARQSTPVKQGVYSWSHRRPAISQRPSERADRDISVVAAAPLGGGGARKRRGGGLLPVIPRWHEP